MHTFKEVTDIWAELGVEELSDDKSKGNMGGESRLSGSDGDSNKWVFVPRGPAVGP